MSEQLDLEAIYSRLGHANGIGLDEAVARHYRQDVPVLLREVERLRAVILSSSPGSESSNSGSDS